MQPTISVIVPVYKAEKYLHRCVDSILSQTFADFELILVNDGSPDNCGKICDEYAQKDSRIKVIHKENGGSNSARRDGFINSTGKYLVFLDSDDTLSDGALSILYNNIIKGYDVVKGGIVKVNKKDEIISTECFRISEGIIEGTENIIKKIFNGDIAPYLCGSIYKRELFTADVFNKSIEARISFGEDWLTNLMVADKTDKILCIKDIVYNYFINHDSITHSQVVSIEYIKRVEKVLSEEGITNIPYLTEDINVWYSLNRINRFFIPEIGFKYNEYKNVKETIDRSNIKSIIKEKTNKKYMYFFNCMPLYYIYSRLYCLLFYLFKLKCKTRKVIS